MREARKTPVTIIVAVTVILLISYLIIDYFNIPTALGMDISRINIDLLGNVINAVIAIFVFVSGYCLIDRWNVKKVNNQKAIAESVLHSIYKNCLRIASAHSSTELLSGISGSKSGGVIPNSSSALNRKSRSRRTSIIAIFSELSSVLTVPDIVRIFRTLGIRFNGISQGFI